MEEKLQGTIRIPIMAYTEIYQAFQVIYNTYSLMDILIHPLHLILKPKSIN